MSGAESRAAGDGPALRASELVARLWAGVPDAASAEGELPEVRPTSRMIHDADLMHLEAHRDIDLPELLAHLVPLLGSLAERRDELVEELRMLRQAVAAESRRLAERDDLLHGLLEARIERLEQRDGPR